ncbi:hypothetical protein PAXRUDRAFT_140255 [Paxillus rubicundulus Ve08.2h10]|uniref:Uncharacterized protein n=1 Tax=Paxillus rubicundulus Ve08.2h10 TaxID=930991 RepID=A0A0D0E3S7_9AGAM|nr:hypothetical protein PAXRUDRAFT_140255 [Paxillus rubicundulus Ve08.2h10]
MNTTALPSSSYPPSEYTLSPEHTDLVMSTRHVIEQTPPPSLREILGAYKSKGDGDRDMLIAMLNAKSAEDQRMAAVASLHRALLELSAVESRTSTPVPPQSFLQSPYLNSSKHNRHPGNLSNSHPSASSHTLPPPSRDPPHQSQPPRKRQRSSRSPASSSHHDARTSHPSSRELPPSPYSSSRSDSEEYSPRSRTSMAIGSLLSTGPGRESAPDDSPNAPEATQTRLPPSVIGVSA